ncbi:helix-turn-helix domain-containing protein [Morganella morganii]|nr:helix-turn-helix transcriptional regulator [Morganella morganii]
MPVIDEHKKATEYYVGAMIKTLRKKRGMSGVDLAAELGISQQQISRYETGQSQISVGQLLTVISVFGLSPEAFFTEIRNAYGESVLAYIVSHP